MRFVSDFMLKSLGDGGSLKSLIGSSSFTLSVVLALVTLNACEPKSFLATDPPNPPVDLPQDSGLAVSDASTGNRSSGAGGHAGSTSGEADGPSQEPDGPTEIIPVSSDVAGNIKKSLERGVPKGPDCKEISDPKAATVDCVNGRLSFSQKLWTALFPQAWAALGGGGPSIPDRSFTQSQLLSLAIPGSDMWSTYRKFSKIHVFEKNDGPVFNDFDLVITFVSGDEMWASGNSDILKSCRVIDATFPRDSKEYFEVVEMKGTQKSLLKSPTMGKSCSLQSLKDYRVLNFYAESKDKKPVPTLVMMIAKDDSKKQSYVLRRKLKGQKDFLAKLFDHLSPPAAVTAPPAVKKKGEL